jgi:hypothetical protein
MIHPEAHAPARDVTRVVTVTPGPHEVALARVPAGYSFRFPLRAGFTDVPAVPARDEVAWTEVPGPETGLWGADLTTRYSAHAIGLGRRKSDRAVWQRAARMLARGPDSDPAVIYVLLRETPHAYGVIWLAVSIREEPDPIDGEGSDLD